MQHCVLVQFYTVGKQHRHLAPCLQEELAAELCLLAPARLEHLIPPMPRMMHAVLRALRGSDQSVSVALKVQTRSC